MNQNSSEAEHIVQKRTNYSDQIRDEFIALKRQYRVLSVTDTRFVADLQQAGRLARGPQGAARTRQSLRSFGQSLIQPTDGVVCKHEVSQPEGSLCLWQRGGQP